VVIGLFTDTYPPDINGVATAVATLFDELKKSGHEVYVITTNLPKHRKTEIDGNIIRVPGVTLKRLYNYRLTKLYPRKAARYLNKIKFDVIHANTESTIGMFARIYAKKKKLPMVYTYHSIYYDFTTTVAKKDSLFDKFLKSCVKKISKKLAKTPAEFITPSLKSANVLRSYGINRYINIIPNGIKIAEYEYKPYPSQEIQSLREKYGIKENEKIISVVGRLAEEKGIDEVLSNFRFYINISYNQNVKLLLVGDGPHRKSLEQKVKYLYLNDYVVFTGNVPHDDIFIYYQLSDVLISGSKSETQGLTINEAMASKCLVLAINDDSFKYSITEGETGFLYNSSLTFTDQLNKIFALTKEEKGKIIENAYNNNKRICSPRTYTEEVVKVYEKAARKCW